MKEPTSHPRAHALRGFLRSRFPISGRPARALVLAALIFAQPLLAQPVIQDTGFLRLYAQTNRFRTGQPGSITPTPDGTLVLFLRSPDGTNRSQDLWAYEISSKREWPLLSANDLLSGNAENLSPEELARRERTRSSTRGITGYDLSDDGATLLVPLSGRLFVIDVGNALTLARLKDPSVAPLINARTQPLFRELPAREGGPIDARFSPDAKFVACVRENALHVIEVATGIDQRVSPKPSGAFSYGEAEFVAQEEMDRSEGYWWSPDSTNIAFQCTDTSRLETFTIADPLDPAKPATTSPYPRAGKANADVSLFIAPVRTLDPNSTTLREPDAHVDVRWDRAKYPYLAKVLWPTLGTAPNSKPGPLTILVQNRTQTAQKLLEVNPATGATTEILHEADPAWINLFAGSPRFLDDGSFLWLSEQPPATTGTEPAGATLSHRTLQGETRDTTKGLTFGAQGIVGFDKASNAVLLADATHNPGTSVIAWSLDASKPATIKDRLTEPGCMGETSQVGVIAPHGLSTWVRTISGLDTEPRWEVMQQDKAVGTLGSKATAPPITPKVQIVTDLTPRKMLAAVLRPQNFDPRKQYPVLDFAYAGPHSNVVNANARAYLLHQWFADQGFIVVAIDGRGTPRRGRAWEREIHNNLIDAALQDHCDAIKELCTRFPEMDASRVGVNGWSFGGYFAAMAVMRRPDVYRAGVAGAPVADWQDYDTHYTERYLGMPLPVGQTTDGVPGNQAGYDASNVTAYCKDLTRPLLLIHGTADDNVFVTHSLKIADALNCAGKRYEFLPLPGQTHMVTQPDLVEQVQSRIAGFFLEHLR